VQARRPRFAAQAGEVREVSERFMTAAAGGDLPALLAVLAPDVVLTSDGGGFAAAARRPVLGADNVAAFLAGLARRYADGVTVEAVAVNAGPGAVVRIDGRVDLVLSWHVAYGRIQAVYAVRNPHKLALIGDVRPLSR
jgi:RNA polymerase sigma-70 factor (ECF subfamily)